MKPVAGYRPLAYASPEAVQTTGTVANTSFTLANMDPAGNGTFIQNDTGRSSNDILMSFSGLTVSSVSFDFEIFPDGSCTALSGNNCGGAGNPYLPDLTLLANGSQLEAWDALAPGSSGNSHGVFASPYLHSRTLQRRTGAAAPRVERGRVSSGQHLCARFSGLACDDRHQQPRYQFYARRRAGARHCIAARVWPPRPLSASAPAQGRVKKAGISG